MDDLEKFLFADDGLDGDLDKQSGPAMLETMIIFLESMKMTGQNYAKTYQQTDQQLHYLEQRITDLRKRFAKLPPPSMVQKIRMSVRPLDIPLNFPG